MRLLLLASLSLVAAAAALVLAPAVVRAQGVGCEFLPGTNNVEGRVSGSSRITYVSRPRIRCSDGRYIEADSAVSFESSGYTELTGRVYFQDPDKSLRAQEARYYDNLGRVEATGSVVLTDRQTGNVLRGERLLYLRQSRARSQEELTMTGGRPEATLYPEPDSTAAPDDEVVPYEVVADRIYLLGDRRFQANGNVEVERDSLTASGQTMDYDREAGTIDFTGGSRVKQGEMDLTGREIHMVLPQNRIREVTAREESRLMGQDVDLEAHTIRLFLTDGELDRVVAVGASRVLGGAQGDSTQSAMAPPAAPTTQPTPPDSIAADSTRAPRQAVATAETLVATADSLDIVAPGQTLERLVAIGTARAVSNARDSLNTPDMPDFIRKDWISGDTVIAVLHPDTSAQARARPDSARRPYVLERLVASLNARSFYRLDPDSTEGAPPRPDTARAPEPMARPDSIAAPPDSLQVAPDSVPTGPRRPRLPINYVEADRIVIEFKDGAVDRMDLTGLRRGIYLTPGSGSRTSRVGGEP